jgi:hypothetical protein
MNGRIHEAYNIQPSAHRIMQVKQIVISPNFICNRFYFIPYKLDDTNTITLCFQTISPVDLLKEQISPFGTMTLSS